MYIYYTIIYTAVRREKPTNSQNFQKHVFILNHTKHVRKFSRTIVAK